MATTLPSQKTVHKHERGSDSTFSSAEVSALLHATLFAYQKKLSEILGSGEAIFTHPIIKTIKLINEETGLNLIKGQTPDQAFENYAQTLINAKVVKKAEFEKLNSAGYLLHIDECVFAEHIHHLLKPKDVTCPWALLAMSIFEAVTNKKVRNAKSTYTELGCKTKIEEWKP